MERTESRRDLGTAMVGKEIKERLEGLEAKN